MNTPVVLLIFNRPDKTKKALEVIRQVKPERLLIIADGPRQNHSGDTEQCVAARKLVEQVDWKCEISKNYSEHNLGCAKRVSSGLDWVFSQVEEAIILEDDCIPDFSFFHFCQELLDRFKDDERIMVISGLNIQFGRGRTQYDYYFSRYNHCWGWATWKRAWQHFDYDMTLWPEVRDSKFLENILLDPHDAKSWTRTFQQVYENRVNSWAFRWTFACWMQSGLTILPTVNLISNIGFDEEATHTREKNKFCSQPTVPLTFPLKHPPFIIRDSQADNFTQKTAFNYHEGLMRRTGNRIRKIVDFY